LLNYDLPDLLMKGDWLERRKRKVAEMHLGGITLSFFFGPFSRIYRGK